MKLAAVYQTGKKLHLSRIWKYKLTFSLSFQVSKLSFLFSYLNDWYKIKSRNWMQSPEVKKKNREN